MSIGSEWIVFDTNIWIFGLRNPADQPACFHLLQGLNMLYVKNPISDLSGVASLSFSGV